MTKRLLTWVIVLAGVYLALQHTSMLFGPNPAVMPYFAILGLHRERYYPAIAVAASFAALGLAAPYALSRAPLWKRLSALIGVGMAMQMSVFAANGTVSHMEERLWNVGHTEFVRIAKAPLPPNFVGRYEQLLAENKWVYPTSKGPGTLYAYRFMVLVSQTRFGDWFDWYWQGSHERLAPEDERISSTALFLFPLFTYLVLWPLYFLAKELTNERGGITACLLFLAVPSPMMVVMHMDCAPYPFYGVLGAALAVVGHRQRCNWLIALGGVALSWGAFSTFALLSVAMVVGVWLGWDSLFCGAASHWRSRIVRALVSGASFVAGFVAFHALLVLVLHYHPFARFHSAMEFHKNWGGGPIPVTFFENYLQFAGWFGLPLIALLVAEFVSTVQWQLRRIRTSLVVWTLACMVLIWYNGYFAKGETGRMWIFWTPLLVIAPAAWLARQRGHKLTGVVMAAQIAYAFALNTQICP